VGPLHDEVADVALEPLLLPSLQAVAESHRFVDDAHAPRARLAPRRRAGAARPRIHPPAAGTDGRRFELLARARAGVDASLGDQTVERRLIQRGARALPHDLAVPWEAVRIERGKNALGGRFATARLVDVLDAHEPFPAGRGRVAIARERRDERAEVQRAG